MAGTIDDWLRGVDAADRDLATETLAIVRGTLEDAEEAVKWNQPVFVVDGENAVYLSAQAGYVNLGFFAGASLADPTGLLEGTGASMRHVKIRDPSQLDDPALVDLLEAAAVRAEG